MIEYAKAARNAALKLSTITTNHKNKLLWEIKNALVKHQETIEVANRKDCELAATNPEITKPMLKRLECCGEKFNSILLGIDDVVKLEDPVGQCNLAKQLTEGLHLYRLTTPIGVLLIIFESRPEACIQILSLALKSGNAVLLKGGKESKNTIHAMSEAVKDAFKKCEYVPEACVQFIDSREDVAAMLKMDKYVDLVIPRGSNSLVKYIKNNTIIPVLGHADGLCLAYVDKTVNVEEAANVVADSKTNYPAACNAVETLIIHDDVKDNFIPALVAVLGKQVQFRADTKSISLLPSDITTAITEEDYDTEYLENILAVKVVNSIEEAVEHINLHGSHHTDVICTKDPDAAEYFMQAVDSAGVYCNASTRFADGFRYGFGAEIGISTSRLHARGPVGLEGLVTYKYRLYGTGQCNQQFSSDPKTMKKLEYHHKPLDISPPKYVLTDTDVKQYQTKYI